VIGTVADRALVDRIFAERGIEAVIHGGALHKPDIVRYPNQAFVEVNLNGTLDFSKSLDQCVEGRGTQTLMVLCKRMYPHGGQRDAYYEQRPNDG